MEYNKQDFLSDFINRTLTNLEYIQQAEKQGKTVYEVTQLVNSCLGVIVFLQQYGDGLITDADICPILLQDLQNSITTNTYKRNRKKTNFNNILYHLRNALSHGKLDFTNEEHDGKMQISSIKFTDTDIKDKNQKFIITLNIAQIEQLAKSTIKISNYYDKK